MSDIIANIIESPPVIVNVSDSPSIVVEITDGHIHLNKAILDATEHAFTEKEKIIIYTFVHDQTIASDVWNIKHNLDKCPSISVVDSAGTLVVGDVQYISRNEVIVSFIGEFSGKAYLN